MGPSEAEDRGTIPGIRPGFRLIPPGFFQNNWLSEPPEILRRHLLCFSPVPMRTRFVPDGCVGAGHSGGSYSDHLTATILIKSNSESNGRSGCCAMWSRGKGAFVRSNMRFSVP